MVVFICGGCNESLKKNKLENHLTRCSSDVVSCCDCGKEFHDDSYKKHNICITEDQKYGPQTDKNCSEVSLAKGQSKQNDFTKLFQKAIKKAKVSGMLEMALNKLTEYPNVPRKKAKFEKFMQSCVGISNVQVIADAWKIVESVKSDSITPKPEKIPKHKKNDNIKDEKMKEDKAVDEKIEDDKTSDEKMEEDKISNKRSLAESECGGDEESRPKKKKKKKKDKKKKHAKEED